jgi:hypothetical protein
VGGSPFFKKSGAEPYPAKSKDIAPQSVNVDMTQCLVSKQRHCRSTGTEWEQAIKSEA